MSHCHSWHQEPEWAGDGFEVRHRTAAVLEVALSHLSLMGPPGCYTLNKSVPMRAPRVSYTQVRAHGWRTHLSAARHNSVKLNLALEMPENPGGLEVPSVGGDVCRSKDPGSGLQHPTLQDQVYRDRSCAQRCRSSAQHKLKTRNTRDLSVLWKLAWSAKGSLLPPVPMPAHHAWRQLTVD